MRLRWFSDNSVALCADNFARLWSFCFGRTALLDEDGFSSRFAFLIMVTDYRIDVQKTPQISKKSVNELITLQREYVQNCENFFTGGDRKKK